jgi:hypothetical protein
VDDENDKGNSSDEEATSTNRLTLRHVKNNALDNENGKGNDVLPSPLLDPSRVQRS